VGLDFFKEEEDGGRNFLNSLRVVKEGETEK